MAERTLVVVFLRGGADGLTLVPPVGDDAYHRARPTLAVSANSGHRLDDRFHLHPALDPLAPYFDAGQLAVIQACGSEDDTRSHFYAQDLMEHGGTTVSGGWLGRFLHERRATSNADVGVLDAITIGSSLSESLRGAPTATAFTSFDDLAGDARDRALLDQLGAWYREDEMLGPPAIAALAAGARLDALRQTQRSPANGARYPEAGSEGPIAATFGAHLKLVADLIAADVGLGVACIDVDGWDSHFVQETITTPRITALGSGLAAFAADLGSQLDHVTVVVMSEFGRRVAENTSLGTDHGRGGACLVLGGGTHGGLHCDWPGIDQGWLDGPGDVPVVHNYRDVLIPVLARHGAQDVRRIFPAHHAAQLAI